MRPYVELTLVTQSDTKCDMLGLETSKKFQQFFPKTNKLNKIINHCPLLCFSLLKSSCRTHEDDDEEEEEMKEKELSSMMHTKHVRLADMLLMCGAQIAFIEDNINLTLNFHLTPPLPPPPPLSLEHTLACRCARSFLFSPFIS